MPIEVEERKEENHLFTSDPLNAIKKNSHSVNHYGYPLDQALDE
jgi:hypothetical protein